MSVTWSLRALRELRAQRQYIAQTQPEAAARVAARILAAVERLADFPEYGRVAAWDARQRMRELPVAGTPFVVLYVIAEDAVVIVRVLHGAQRRGQ